MQEKGPRYGRSTVAFPRGNELAMVGVVHADAWIADPEGRGRLFLTTPGSSWAELCAHNAFVAVRLRACVEQMVALTVNADDEHGAAVAIAERLIWGEIGRRAAMGGGVSDALAEAAMAEFIGAAEEFDREVGVVRSQSGFHGAVVLVAKGKDVSPHRHGV